MTDRSVTLGLGGVRPNEDREPRMMPEGQHRNLAQHIRQNARAQLQEIRKVRLGSDRGPDQVPDLPPMGGARRIDRTGTERHAKRQHRADRLAALLRQAQELRLDAALAAGMIELWESPVVSIADVPVSGSVMVLAADHIREFFRPWPDVVGPDLVADQASSDQTEPLSEYFGPPWDPAQAAMQLADQTKTLLGAFFGPLRGLEGDDVGQVGACAEGPLDGAVAAPPPEPEPDKPAAPDIKPALTLSDDMRVLWQEPAPEVVGAALEDVPQIKVFAGSEHMPDDFPYAEILAQAATHARQIPPSVRATNNDLALLPGAGPALIWMLQKCGISSLQALAQADAKVLVPRLGLVGQIVDVRGWQQFARAQGRRGKNVIAG